MREKRHELSKGLLGPLPAAARERLGREGLEFGSLARKAVREAPELARQRAEAVGLADELLTFHHDTRLRRLRRSLARFRSRPLAEEILRRSRLALFEKPREGLELAELALEVALHLGRRPALCGGRAGLVDLHARCLAYLGNACRVNCRFKEAEANFADAFALREEGTGDPLLYAEMLSFRGSLLLDQRDGNRALEVLDEAVSLFFKARQTHLEGRAVLQKAAAFYYLGDPSKAAETYLEALRLLDDDEEPTVAVAAWSNLAACCHQLGRHEEARQFLEAARPLFALCPPESTVHLNHAWVEGMVAVGLGELGEAEEAYTRALAGFQKVGHAYNEALLALDLAELWTKQGRLAEVEKVAEAAYSGLKRYALHKEALAAFSLFVDAARTRKLTEAVVRYAAQTLRQHPARVRRGKAPGMGNPLEALAASEAPSEALTEPATDSPVVASRSVPALERAATPAEELGRAMSWLRRYRCRSQRQVARAMSINPGMVSAWETGAKQPRLGALQELLRALDSNFADLEAALATVRTYPSAGRRIPSRRGVDPLAHPLDHELIRAALDDSPGARTEAAAARAMLRLLARAGSAGEA